jgi:hypothetical protein
MDDGKLICGKDLAQQIDATELPSRCPPTALGRFQPVVMVSNRPEAASRRV